MYVYIPHIYEAYKPLPSGGEGGGGKINYSPSQLYISHRYLNTNPQNPNTKNKTEYF